MTLKNAEHNNVSHWQLHNPLLSNMSNMLNATCKPKLEPGKQVSDSTTTRQRGRIPSNHTTRHQTLLAPTNPWRTTPGWYSQGLGRLLSNCTRSRP